MPTSVITATGTTFTNSGLPVLTYDPLITPLSIALFDFGNPVTVAQAGNPTSGTALVNMVTGLLAGAVQGAVTRSGLGLKLAGGTPSSYLDLGNQPISQKAVMMLWWMRFTGGTPGAYDQLSGNTTGLNTNGANDLIYTDTGPNATPYNRLQLFGGTAAGGPTIGLFSPTGSSANLVANALYQVGFSLTANGANMTGTYYVNGAAVQSVTNGMGLGLRPSAGNIALGKIRGDSTTSARADTFYRAFMSALDANGMDGIGRTAAQIAALDYTNNSGRF